MQANDIQGLVAQAAMLIETFPQADLIRGIHCLTVPATNPGGFRTRFAIDEQQCTLYFDECAVDVASTAQALELLELALSGELRLRIDTVSGRPHRWSVERRKVDGGWRTEHVVSVFNFKFWGRTASVCRQNDFGPRVRAPANEMSSELTGIAA